MVTLWTADPKDLGSNPAQAISCWVCNLDNLGTKAARKLGVGLKDRELKGEHLRYATLSSEMNSLRDITVRAHD